MNYTKTINPLHFEDLDPHRFEDLVRQIIYDFKDWKSLEATGKKGADDGIDILGIENKISIINQEEKEFRIEELTWIIQCKRYNSITPKQVVDTIENDIGKQEQPPYGYILVTSTNFSKRARDAFKLKMIELKIQEFYFYGKAELEDLLFQPKYDHLLFAYFGLSLQRQRRSLKSNLNSLYSTKKKLIKTLGSFGEIKNQTVLIKDVECPEYPVIENDKILNWRYYKCCTYEPVNAISLIVKKQMAYVDFDKKEWDKIKKYDDSFPMHEKLFKLSENYYDQILKKEFEAQDDWNKIDEDKKGWYYELKYIPFENIILIDEIGDKYHPEIHLNVVFENGSPFKEEKFSYTQSLLNRHQILKCKEGKKIDIF